MFAAPVAVFTSCQLRGDYVFAPGEPKEIAPALEYQGNSLLIGLAAGLPLTAALIVAAVFLWRKARRGEPVRHPGADPHGFTPDPRS